MAASRRFALLSNIWFDWGMSTTIPAMAVGKIVKSNTHVDYVCQIYGANEMLVCPQPTDYCFGTFVSIAQEDNGAPGGQLIGVIYNTLLMNPDFGSLGPRLSPKQDLEIFTPDYLAETATLVGIIAVGWIDTAGNCRQGVPMLAATINNPVYRLDEDELHHFHTDAGGRLTLRYVPLLLSQNNPLVSPLLISIIDRLTALFPAQQGQLTLMRNNLAWKSIVQPASLAPNLRPCNQPTCSNLNVSGPSKAPAKHPTNTPLSRPTRSAASSMANLSTIWLTSKARRAPILGRVTARRVGAALPRQLYGRPQCAARRRWPRCLGYDSDANELFEITVAVLGYHSTSVERVYQPARAAGRGCARLYCRRRAAWRGVLSRRKQGERGSAHLGSLLSRAPRCRARGAGCAWLHQHAPGDHRQHRQRQELSGRRAAGRDDDALQPRRRADRRPARRIQHAARDAEPSPPSARATTSPPCASFARTPSACASTR